MGRADKSSCCHLRRRRALVLGNHNAVGYPHESSYDIKVIGYPVRGQAFEEYLPIGYVLDAPIQHNQHAVVGCRPDKPPKPLFEGNSGLWNLIIKESAASTLLDRIDARLDDGIAGYGKRKPIDNHAAQLQI